MEKLKQAVKEIAYAQDQAKLPEFHRSLIPFLSFASSIYGAVLSLRHSLYRSGFFSKHRLPVPVISVGNLTWGGNGKTPMVEFIAKSLADYGISPLILTRGYAGGDEAKMLQRHLLGGPVKVGVGANRAAIANIFFVNYGYLDCRGSKLSERTNLDQKVESQISSEKIGAVIMDDGMQHWSLCRDIEIVMINGLMPWGNGHLLPLGPLREPLMALKRAHIAVVHNADLVLGEKLKDIELAIRETKDSLPIFHTRMAPSHFFDGCNINTKMHLEAVNNAVVLCVSAVGSANAFVQGMGKLGPFYVDRFDFTDHHSFQNKDIQMIRKRLIELEDNFGSKPIVVVTEKIIPHKGSNEDRFKLLLKELLEV
ncbi:Tetraacyldisaccharide 4'-kinase [Corchorus olitorius]|uniref:tetraacyldisaccharide 4'-kinase n=1 Tax=Corchorus olitorius TaxID=93759 RepID=A0A1R3KBE9_9ROSI|nr:Tetraacyldisaccharide 4'-kinase [Corchorus olitorius]